jgi:hypothetical protein
MPCPNGGTLRTSAAELLGRRGASSFVCSTGAAPLKVRTNSPTDRHLHMHIPTHDLPRPLSACTHNVQLATHSNASQRACGALHATCKRALHHRGPCKVLRRASRAGARSTSRKEIRLQVRTALRRCEHMPLRAHTHARTHARTHAA